MAGAVTDTDNNDTVQFGNYNDVTIDGALELGKGKDTLNIGSDSTAVVGDVTSDVLTLSIGSRSDVTTGDLANVNRLTTNAGNYDSKTASTNWTLLKTYNITGTSGNDTIQLGNYNDVTIDGALELGKGKDTLNIGSDSKAVVGDVTSDVLTLSIGSRSDVTTGALTNLTKLTTSTGSATLATHVKVAGAVTGTDNNDTVQFGNYNNMELRDVSLGLGKDTLKIGTDSKFTAGNITLGNEEDNATDQISVGKNTTFTVLDITLGAGNDTVSLNDAAIFNATSLDFGAGSDTLSLGNGTTANIAGKTSFSIDGMNKVIVGNDATLVMKSDTSNVTFSSFTLGKKSEAYLSSELVEKVTKIDDDAKVYNIGSFDVAACFTDIDTENNDNTQGMARELDLGTYNGWLSNVDGCQDLKDFVKVGSAVSLNCTAGDDVRITLWKGEEGTVVTKRTGISLEGYSAISFDLSDDAEVKKPNKYTYTLA